MEIRIACQWAVETGAHGGSDLISATRARRYREADHAKILRLPIRGWAEPNDAGRINSLAAVAEQRRGARVAIDRGWSVLNSIPIFPNSAARIRLRAMIGQQRKRAIESRFPAIAP